MMLAADLARARSEEDVKDAYTKAFGLKPKEYFKGLVDIQTDAVWFEAKGSRVAPLIMFAQLLVYIRGARLRGEPVPAFLAVIDPEKGATLPTEAALPVLDDPAIVWPASGSAAGKELAAQIAPYIDKRITTYPIATLADEFCDAIKAAIREGRIIKTPITPDNLRQVFDKWVGMIGGELGVADADLSTLFFADIMFDEATGEASYGSIGAYFVTLDGRPAFVLRGWTGGPLRVADVQAYRNFWSIYLRPPRQDHRRWLYERRELLLPLNLVRFQGEFYTPLHIVDKAYDQLLATLGEGWQDRYIVWDMCCGIGNLETKHSNPRNVYMSTLLERDVDIMRENNVCPGAEKFQYDYLNDDVTDFGDIDYSLTNKVPMALRQAIADAKEGKEGAKPILVLINPPYAEMTSGGNTARNAVATSKPGVTRTKFAQTAMSRYGKARNDLLLQFVARAYQELPSAILGLVSKLKYVTTPTANQFRRTWLATYLSGFVVHSRSFDTLTGEFPIGFLVWDTGKPKPISSVDTILLDRLGRACGEKRFLNYDGLPLLTDWVIRPTSNTEPVVPLKDAIVPATAQGDLRGTRWSDRAVAWLNCAGNDPQNANSKTMLFSSGYGSARGFFVNADNLTQATLVFAARRLTKPTWVNDRDQFLQPSTPLSNEFANDCLIWMLFNSSNLTAGADGLRWNDRDWSLVNHFIPFTEAEVDATGRFESDFMIRHVKGTTFSPEAQAVLDRGRELWRQFHRIALPRRIRDELKLNRPDAGWYQIRRALEAYGDTELTDFDPFRAAYAALTAKLRPQVYEYGFLPT